MLNKMKNSGLLTIKMRFTIILSTLVIGFSLFGFATFKAMNALNVNGPIYQRIVQGKDIIADVLPPPEYIIESYLVTLQLTQAADPAEISALVTRFAGRQPGASGIHRVLFTNNIHPKNRS